MGYIGLYGSIHMETFHNDNGNDVIIKWVLCPIVTTMATTVSVAFAAVSVNYLNDSIRNIVGMLVVCYMTSLLQIHCWNLITTLWEQNIKLY